MTTSGTTNENEWQQVVRVTASDTESEHEWQRVTKNGNEWQRVINEWIRMKVGTTGRFYDSKETKGQSGSWIILFNFICNTVRRCFSKYVFLKFATSTVKHLCWSLFLIKMQAWRHVTLLNRDSCFSVNIAKFLRKEHLRWLLLYLKFVGNLMTYINREIDDIYFQYNTLCLSCISSFFFFAISFAEFVKTR